MKVQITNEGECYFLYKEGSNRPAINYRARLSGYFSFYDDDIFNLIGEKNFNTSFQSGKYEYNVPVKHLQLITGERSAQNRNELELYPN